MARSVDPLPEHAVPGPDTLSDHRFSHEPLATGAQQYKSRTVWRVHQRP